MVIFFINIFICLFSQVRAEAVDIFLILFINRFICLFSQVRGQKQFDIFHPSYGKALGDGTPLSTGYVQKHPVVEK